MRVSVGDGTADLFEQSQPLGDRQALCITGFGDRSTIDVLEHHVRHCLGIDARVEQPSDRTVGEPGEQLAFAVKSSQGLGTHQTSADPLDGDLAGKAALVALSQPHLAHPAPAEGLDQTVRPKFEPRLVPGGGRLDQPTLERQRTSTFVFVEQLTHTAHNGGVEGRVAQAVLSPLARQVDEFAKQCLQTVPGLGVHAAGAYRATGAVEDRCPQFRRPGATPRRRTHMRTPRSLAFVSPAFVLTIALLVVAPLGAATITVDQPQDIDADDAACSLREAILAANTDSAYHGCASGDGPDRIVFALAIPASITLIAPLPLIEETLLLRGPGATNLTIDGANTWSLVAFDSESPNPWLGVEDLTLARGLATSGGGALVSDGATAHFLRVLFLDNRAGAGGGLQIQSGSLASISQCWFSGNTADGVAGGGGLYAAGNSVVVVDRSTLSENSATHANGNAGGLTVNGATVHLSRTTISGNTASSGAGGVLLQGTGAGASLTVRDTTITANQATTGDGGGLQVRVLVGETIELELSNSIIAGNTDTTAPSVPDLHLVASPLLSTSGFNLIGSNEGTLGMLPDGLPNGSGDWVGTSAAPLDALLGPLDFYDGLTPTHRPTLVPLSPAIDAGSCIGAAGDQRGFGNLTTGLRVVDVPAIANGPGSDGCDIGAHERAAEAGVDRVIFSNGFEEGHTLLWSAEVL